ncbi:tyramine oxidase [Scytonema hofmannii PCC 7110]|uniref:Amine oxidase n=1 Tax=Scytonema hofmannii PCC 7110 TaxID=128403 RepID=A0A139XHH0_9CYAN|nr:primary-amine oxidase [Scytonema hofmannii]KYC44144.1 tyramine oxidase [Scytonema hofmannii PCC 7110]
MFDSTVLKGKELGVFNWHKWLAIPISIILVILISVGLIGITSAQEQIINHPLAPLTELEIKTAVAVIRKEKTLTERAAFPILTLQEPDKNEVLNFTPNRPFQRQAFIVIYEQKQNKTYEAVVDLKTKTLSSWKEIPDVQPAMFFSEYELAAKIVKSDLRWQQAMRKRSIANFQQVIVSCWAPGILSQEEHKTGHRLCRGLSYYKGNNWNYLGSPIEGVLATVDLNTRKVTSFIDSGVVPFSKENWNYDPKTLGKLRPSPKTLKIQQPDGVDFSINGNEVSWQGWKFRYQIHPRDGLVLYLVSYNDGENIRPVLYRASLSEMVVPYGNPDPTWSFRNAFDVGEYNFGTLATTMELGKEIPENGILLDAVLADDKGKPLVMPGVIGIYERDKGMLWKHYEYNTKRNDVRRWRELVVTTTTAIENYDYGISWIFHQDGTLEVETDLTGIILAQATASQKQSENEPYGKLVAKNILGVNHQHIFNFRLDMDVDSQANQVMEMNVKALPSLLNNPLGNAFMVEESPLTTETTAVRDLDMKHSREWMIVSSDRKNTLGAATGYMLMPGGNTVLFPVESAAIRKTAAFATHHVWVTKYQPGELYAAGDYPNQTQTAKGLPEYISNDESLMGEDIVLWYTMGVTHIPRPEDWPVMSTHRVGFKLVPRGFFHRNPAINLPEVKAVKTRT